jgi:hypothetical protein
MYRIVTWWFANFRSTKTRAFFFVLICVVAQNKQENFSSKKRRLGQSPKNKKAVMSGGSWLHSMRATKSGGTSASLIERKMYEVAREWIAQQLYEEWFPDNEVYDAEYWWNYLERTFEKLPLLRELWCRRF